MSGIDLIAAERKRQLDAEGWDAKHDEAHHSGELAKAAVCYAADEPVYFRRDSARGVHFIDPWPADWEAKWDKRKKHDRKRRLVIAGALIAAELDRIEREERGRAHV